MKIRPVVLYPRRLVKVEHYWSLEPECKSDLGAHGYHPLSLPTGEARWAESKLAWRLPASYIIEGGIMQVLYERYAGIDVHKKSITVCLVTPEPRRQRHKEVRSYGTTTRSLMELLDWLAGMGCSHVAIESTGVYWKPVWRAPLKRYQLLSRKKE